MLTKERLEESARLIRMYLVKDAEDGDVDALVVRFCELMNEIERLQDDNRSLARCLARIPARDEVGGSG